MSKNAKAFLVILALCSLISVVIIGLGDALAPLMIAFGLSYLFFPLITRIEKYGIKRNVAIGGVSLSLILGLGTICLLVIPDLVSDAKAFLHELPQNSSRALDKATHLASTLGYDLDLSKQGTKEFLVERISMLSTDLVKNALSTTSGMFSSLSRWFLAFLNVFLVPLFFFYVINDYERLSAEVKSFIPGTFRPKLEHYLQLSNTVLSGYIRGQLLVAGLLGILYGAGLWLVGLRFGFLVGLISGLISIIPYAGFTIGFAMALMMALANFTGGSTIAGVVIVYIVVQGLEGTLITPKLVGNKVEIVQKLVETVLAASRMTFKPPSSLARADRRRSS